MPEQAVWSLTRLLQEPLGRVTLWVTPAAHATVAATLPWPISEVAGGIPQDAETLIVVGGGTLLDHAKCARADTAPQVRLIAVPSIWGSGAEASPIAVATLADRKEIRMDDHLLPDVRVLWPELAASVSARQASSASGDTWAHAVEGFLCPLASHEVRIELADIMRALLSVAPGDTGQWLDLSAQACAAQARSGVGLVHGIAHVLEPALRTEQPEAGWGHARLCAAFLAPVLDLLGTVSDKADGLIRDYGLEPADIRAAARGVWSKDDYQMCLPTLAEVWPRVLRDPCTRTSCVLIRASYLEHFH